MCSRVCVCARARLCVCECERGAPWVVPRPAPRWPKDVQGLRALPPQARVRTLSRARALLADLARDVSGPWSALESEGRRLGEGGSPESGALGKGGRGRAGEEAGEREGSSWDVGDRAGPGWRGARRRGARDPA